MHENKHSTYFCWYLSTEVAPLAMAVWLLFPPLDVFASILISLVIRCLENLAHWLVPAWREPMHVKVYNLALPANKWEKAQKWKEWIVQCLLYSLGKTHLEASNLLGKMFNACQRFRFGHRVKETELRCTYNDLSVLITIVLLGCLGSHDYIEDLHKVDIWLGSNTIA